MTRFACRASVPVAFYLLTSAATAYAECAWVLWSKGGSLEVGPLVYRACSQYRS